MVDKKKIVFKDYKGKELESLLKKLEQIQFTQKNYDFTKNWCWMRLKENAKFFLDSLDKSTKSKIENAINKLQEDPFTKGKMLGSLNSGVPFLEKRLFFGPGYRIYYSVLSGRIYIDSLQYAGKVHVLQIGNKKTQKKDIPNAKQN